MCKFSTGRTGQKGQSSGGNNISKGSEKRSTRHKWGIANCSGQLEHKVFEGIVFRDHNSKECWGQATTTVSSLGPDFTYLIFFSKENRINVYFVTYS